MIQRKEVFKERWTKREESPNFLRRVEDIW